MKFENSPYFHSLQHSKIEFSFGNFYLFDTFMISELNEGIHFGWEKIKEVSVVLLKHYGTNINIGYISNRVHSYSMDPLSWMDFQKEYGFIVASAVVYYSDFNYMNATIEKRFSGHSLKRCIELGEAISWIQRLKEFKQQPLL